MPGRRTLVIAQTSNEHLDQLNARAQAIRHQYNELGADGLALLGRPYQLHAGDHVQIRHTIPHPDGAIRNGQIGQITQVDPRADALTIQFASHPPVRLDRRHIDQADLRLAYVQHPFPAQGHTTDTTHMIVAEHATQEGTYVALTRARHATHLYTSHQQLQHPDEPLVVLAQHLGRAQPEIPSIHIPLAHERQIQHEQAMEELPGDATARLPATDQTITNSTSADRVATADPHLDPEWLTRLLGPRPQPTDPTRAIWDQAAHVVERYREEYDIPVRDRRTLGPEPAAVAFQQRIDRRQTAWFLNAARMELGLQIDDESRLFDAKSQSVESRRQLDTQSLSGWEV